MKEAVAASKKDKSAVATTLYPALLKMTEQLAKLQHSSPSFRTWETKARQACKEIASDRDLLKALKPVAVTAIAKPPQTLDGIIQEIPFVDLFLIDSVEKNTTDDVWSQAIKMRLIGKASR